MPSYIGTIANLMPVSWTDEESVTPAPRYKFMDAPGRRWAFVSRRADGAVLREWNVTFSGANRDHAVLDGLAHGHFGDEPFIYIPESATLTNVLTPAQSMLYGVANAGVLRTIDGLSSASLIGGSSTVLADYVPVIAGKPVTVAVNVAGLASLTLQLKTASGVIMQSKVVTSTTTEMKKLVATIPLVGEAVRYITITAAGYTSLAQPQVTWTEGLVPFDVGGGASQVVLSDFSFDWHMYETATRDSWRDMSVKITEVG